MDRQKFAFDKTNFILLAIGMAVIIVGFLLMTGPGFKQKEVSLSFSLKKSRGYYIHYKF